MKYLLTILSVVFVTGCGTVSGAVSGLGDDVKSGTDTVSSWIKPNREVRK
jgi:predicted small secreted protein